MLLPKGSDNNRCIFRYYIAFSGNLQLSGEIISHIGCKGLFLGDKCSIIYAYYGKLLPMK